MPLQYSIRQDHPTIKHGPGSSEYFTTSLEVAESHDEGHYALCNDEGEKVSAWSPLLRDQEKVKPSARSDVRDCIHQPLYVGDYVAYGDSAISPMTIAKILTFTNKQVRVQPMGNKSYRSSRLMYESSLIRLPESFWTGSL